MTALKNDYYLSECCRQMHRFDNDMARILRETRRSAITVESGSPLLLLLSLLRCERNLGTQILERHGIDLCTLRESVEATIRLSTRKRSGILDLTEIGTVVAAAIEFATTYCHPHIGTGHLVVAMCEIDHFGATFNTFPSLAVQTKRSVIEAMGGYPVERVLLKNDSILNVDWLLAKDFTDDARAVLSDVSSRLLRRGLLGIAPEAAVLWSLLHWDEKVALSVLRQSAVDISALIRDLDSNLQCHSQDELGLVLNLELIASVATRAIQIAGELKREYVGTEHLLLALIGTSYDPFAKMLKQHGVDCASVISRLRDVDV